MFTGFVCSQSHITTAVEPIINPLIYAELLTL